MCTIELNIRCLVGVCLVARSFDVMVTCIMGLLYQQLPNGTLFSSFCLDRRYAHLFCILVSLICLAFLCPSFLANVAHIFILRIFDEENGCLPCRKILTTKCYSYKGCLFLGMLLLQVLGFIVFISTTCSSVFTSLFDSFSRFFLLLLCYFL